MNRLVEGEWVAEINIETDDDGEFERQEQAFHDRLGTDAHPVEAGRYHVYISRACPWAHRVAMTRSLKGLDDAVSLSLVQPERYDEGWEFSDAHPDPLYDADYLRELYVHADPEFTGRPTVPVLWDTETKTIVNNESEEIMRTLDVAAHDLATRDVDLYPEGYRDEVDRLIDDIYDPINNGVYRAGFAGSQGAYDRAVDDLFAALDRYDGCWPTSAISPATDSPRPTSRCSRRSCGSITSTTPTSNVTAVRSTSTTTSGGTRRTSTPRPVSSVPSTWTTSSATTT